MGGFLGIGGSSAKTDRNTQLSAQQGLWNVFSSALPEGQGATASGLSSLASAQSYWKNLLTAGRTQTAQNSAPAVNAQLAQSDTARRQEGQMGTARSGGTAAANREASTTTAKSIDDIINQNLMGQKTQAAQGLASVGNAQAGIGLGLEGLGANSVDAIMKNATESRPTSYKINQQEGQAAAQMGLAAAQFLLGL